MTRKAVELALAGDVVALRLCLDRCVPPRRGRPIACELGDLADAKAVKAAHAAVLQACGAGELTVQEAGEVSALLEAHLRTIASADLDGRITELERRMRVR